MREPMVDNKSRSEGLEVKMPKKINIPNGAVLIRGQALDGCDATFLTEDELRDIDTILAYDYEDGKPWHDCTCVLELKIIKSEYYMTIKRLFFCSWRNFFLILR